MQILAATSSGFSVLNAMIIVPAVGALVVALLPKNRPEIVRMIGVLFSATAGALTFWLALNFETGVSGFQFETSNAWIESLGISWSVGVDGISLFLVVLSGLLFPLALIAVNPHHNEKAYTAWLLLLMSGTLGVFVALDLFGFFVMFEIVLVPMYMLIGGWGHGNRIYAATKFFLYTMFGSALMLVAIVTLVALHNADTGVLTFDLVTLGEWQGLSEGTARWLFLAFALAFAIKVPLFPVHTWLPDAHTEAPTAGSVILAGVLLKMGTYGFLRFGLFLFPDATVYFAPAIVTLAVIGIIYGAIAATMQTDLKRLVAYSSVAHMGFIVLGIFALTTQALTGSVIQMLNHGISTGALFLLVGMIYERRKTREISELGGLQKSAPVLAGVFTLVMLSSIGLPGLNGFVGEFLILIGSFESFQWWTVVATIGVILAALYLLWAYQRVFHGEPEGDNATMPDIKLAEMLVMAPLLVWIVGFGVYPKPLLERVEPAVVELLEHVDRYSDDYTMPVTIEVPDIEVEDEGEEAE